MGTKEKPHDLPNLMLKGHPVWGVKSSCRVATRGRCRGGDSSAVNYPPLAAWCRPPSWSAGPSEQRYSSCTESEWWWWISHAPRPVARTVNTSQLAHRDKGIETMPHLPIRWWQAVWQALFSHRARRRSREQCILGSFRVWPSPITQCLTCPIFKFKCNTNKAQRCSTCNKWHVWIWLTIFLCLAHHIYYVIKGLNAYNGTDYLKINITPSRT